jgi:hypothetical protein
MEKMIFGILDDVEGMSYENDFIVLICSKKTWEEYERLDDSPKKYPEAYALLIELGFVDVTEGHYDAQRCANRAEAQEVLEENGFVHDQDFEDKMIAWDEAARAEENDEDTDEFDM